MALNSRYTPKPFTDVPAGPAKFSGIPDINAMEQNLAAKMRRPSGARVNRPRLPRRFGEINGIQGWRKRRTRPGQVTNNV